MIWALLFSLIFSGGGSQLGDFHAVQQLEKKETRVIIAAYLDGPEYKSAVKITKRIRKLTRQTENDINKIYLKLDKLSRKKTLNREKAETLSLSMEEYRREYFYELFDLWKDFRSYFSEEDWYDLIREINTAKIQN
ncbi:MAG: hypothetical protein PQJ58_02220 [Spirochaetales bacterium]|nr:hypothetical protein [Spirochaetales bacterium]